MEKPRCNDLDFGDANIISEYINRKKKDACRLIDTILQEIGNPERKSSAPLNQLSSVMGTLIDKFGADEKDKSLDGTLATLFDDFEDVR